MSKNRSGEVLRTTEQYQGYYFDSIVAHGPFRELIERRRHNGLYTVRLRSFGESIWKARRLLRDDPNNRVNEKIEELRYCYLSMLFLIIRHSSMLRFQVFLRSNLIISNYKS